MLLKKEKKLKAKDIVVTPITLDDIPYEIGKTTLYGLKRGKQAPLEVYHADIKFKGLLYSGMNIGRDMEED